MSDGSGGGVVSKIKGVVAEAVGQPLKNELVQAKNIVSSSITGKYPEPVNSEEAAQAKQAEAIRKQREEQKKANIRGFMQQMQADEQRFLVQKQQAGQSKAVQQQEDMQRQQVREIEVRQNQSGKSASLAQSQSHEKKLTIGG